MKSSDSLKLDLMINLTISMTNQRQTKENLDDLVAEGLSKIKDSIIEALHEENLLFHQKIKKLKSRISVLQTDLNKQDQYNRRVSTKTFGKTKRANQIFN